MKLFYLSALSITLALTSCKKDRTCTCETTILASSGVTGGVGYVNSGPYSTTEDKSTMPKVTKKEARANCVSGENTSTITDPYGDTKTETVRKDCTLK